MRLQPYQSDLTYTTIFTRGFPMGGYGSTRWNGHIKKDTVEDSLVLNGYVLLPKLIKQLKQSPSSFAEGTIRWYVNNRVTSSLNYQAKYSEHATILKLASMSYGQYTEELLRLVWTPTAGNKGRRYWFACPYCSRRCAKLYIPPGYRHFGCRLCMNLTYSSSQEAHTFDNLFKAMAERDGKRENWRQYKRRYS